MAAPGVFRKKNPHVKLFFDFLPIVLFFATFKFAEGHKLSAADFANAQLAAFFPGGAVGPDQAPVLLATLVVMAATLAQVLFVKLRGKRVDTLLWVSLALVVVMGGLTIWLRNETFIKWKPTLLYWAMSASFWLAPLLFGKNLLRSVMGSQVQVPDAVWKSLNIAWALFFAAMGVANLWVAFNFSTETWVSYKLFGGLGLLLAFSIAQAFYLSRFMTPNDTTTTTAAQKDPQP
jgi:intracellular septation protein